MTTTRQTMSAAIAATPLPAAASHGIAHILQGQSVPGTIAGQTSSAMWLNIGGDILVVTAAGTAHLPNGVSTPGFSNIPSDASGGCVAGEGRLRLGGTVLDIVRWWNPHPSLQPTTHAALAEGCRQARSTLEWNTEKIQLDFDGAKSFRRSASNLLGRGQGLTPEGDDVLVGVLAALSLIGPAIADPRAKRMLDALAPIIRVEAPFRTTALSASLLRHAAAGEVAAPVATFLGALTGRGDMAAAAAEIQSMGASSGTATAWGILLTAEALVEGAAV